MKILIKQEYKYLFGINHFPILWWYVAYKMIFSVLTQLAFLSKNCSASLALSECLAKYNAASTNLFTRTENGFNVISKITSQSWN